MKFEETEEYKEQVECGCKECLEALERYEKKKL